MAEYIERDRARHEFAKFFQDSKRLVDDCDSLLCVLPAADVAPVVHGKWMVTKEYNDVIDMTVAKYTCPACGEYRLTATSLSQATNFCPNCGADMRENVPDTNVGEMEEVSVADLCENCVNYDAEDDYCPCWVSCGNGENYVPKEDADG